MPEQVMQNEVEQQSFKPAASRLRSVWIINFLISCLSAALLLTIIDTAAALLRFDQVFLFKDVIELGGRSSLRSLGLSIMSAAIIIVPSVAVYSLLVQHMPQGFLQFIHQCGDRFLRGGYGTGLLIVSATLVTGFAWIILLSHTTGNTNIEFPQIVLTAGALVLGAFVMLAGAACYHFLTSADRKRRMNAGMAKSAAVSLFLVLSGLMLMTAVSWIVRYIHQYSTVVILVLISSVLMTLGAMVAFNNRHMPLMSDGLLRICIVLVTAFLLIMGVTARTNRSARLLHEWTPYSSLITRIFGHWIDVDRDGFYSIALGGSDCNDRDRRICPDGREIASNGIDDNCMMGDLPYEKAGKDANARWTHAGHQPDLRGIVMISIDALRSDYICAGQGDGNHCPTPGMSRFMEKGAYFSRAYSPSNFTSHSMATILSGLYVSGMRMWSDAKGRYTVALPFSLPTMLRAAGIETVMDSTVTLPEPVAAPVWDRNLPAEVPGLYEKIWPKHSIETPSLVDLAMKYLQSTDRNRRFFLWLHTFDTHAPYLLPGRKVPAGINRREAYESVVRFVDRELDPLFKLLSSKDYDDVAVILFSDHGEELGRRPSYGHGDYVYNTSVQVPLGIVAPGVKGRRIEEPVGLVDLVPTVLAMFGLPLDPRLHGSPLPLWGDEKEGKKVFVETRAFGVRKKHAMIMGKYKVIRDLGNNYYELYNIEADPEEHVDLADTSSCYLKSTRQLMNNFFEIDMAYVPGQ